VNIAGNKSWITHRKNGQLITVDDSNMQQKYYGLLRTVPLEEDPFFA
jgi:hypothetical protein